ncbi:hypothetical protein D3C87_1633520 [compost metagenome]
MYHLFHKEYNPVHWITYREHDNFDRHVIELRLMHFLINVDLTYKWSSPLEAKYYLHRDSV